VAFRITSRLSSCSLQRNPFSFFRVVVYNFPVYDSTLLNNVRQFEMLSFLFYLQCYVTGRRISTNHERSDVHRNLEVEIGKVLHIGHYQNL